MPVGLVMLFDINTLSNAQSLPAVPVYLNLILKFDNPRYVFKSIPVVGLNPFVK